MSRVVTLLFKVGNNRQLLLLLVLGATLIAHLPGVTGPFFSDDHNYITFNSRLQEIPLTESYRIFYTATNPYEYAPLRDLVYRIEIALFGDNPLGYHIFNLILYLLVVLAAWRLFYRFFSIYSSGNPRWIEKGALLATAFFALHPAHVEAVAWVASLKDILSGLFFLLCLERIVSAKSRSIKLADMLLISTYLLLTIMSKPAAIGILPLSIILLLAGSNFKFRSSKSLQLILVLLFVALPLFWYAFQVGSKSGIHSEIVTQTTLLERGQRALLLLGYFVRIALAPFNLRFIYETDASGAMLVLIYSLGVAGIIVGVVGTVLFLRKVSIAGFGCSLFTLMLIPYLQLVPFVTISPVSERFLFIPIAGVAIIFARVMLAKDNYIRNILAAALLALFLFATYNHSSKWQSNRALVEDTANLSPGSSFAQSLYIKNILLKERRFEEARVVVNRIEDVMERTVLAAEIDLGASLARGDRVRAQEVVDWFFNSMGPNGPCQGNLALARHYESFSNRKAAYRFFVAAEKSCHYAADKYSARAGINRLRSGGEGGSANENHPDS